MTAREALKHFFGYDSFRKGQEDIIASITAGRDVLAIMPTGAGKSICYQVPALMLPGVCLVISPLISLMQDQVKALNEVGIHAAFINSSLTEGQIRRALALAAEGAYKIVYVAPERLESYDFLEFAGNVEISMVTVDEAHCISQWGQDFRPSYLKIVDFIRNLPKRPIVSAFTATATEEVKEDILCILSLIDPYVAVTGFDRENLYYRVESIRKKDEFVIDYIAAHPEDSGIIYCATRKNVDKLFEALFKKGVPVTRYHAGMDNEARKKSQDDFIYDRAPVIIATNAFGMGIDKSNVRYVIHYNMPQSMENYYQEAGRAGRDGRRSYAVLLCSADDPDRIAKRFEAEFPPIEDIKRVYERISNYLQVAVGDGRGASFVFNIHDFCARERLYPGTVQSALRLLQQNGYMTLTDEQEHPARVMFCVSRDDLYKIRIQRDELDHFIRTLLRLYNGVFSSFRPIDDNRIAAAAGCDVHCVRETLKSLWRMHVIRYIPSSRSPMILFDTERLPTADLYIAPQTYRRRYDMMHERFSNMLRYAESDEECRSVAISRYFGEHDAAPCGVCDVCLDRKHRGKRGGELPEKILSLLKIRPMSVRELIDSVGGDARRAAEAVDKLISEGKISLGAQGKLAIIE